MKRLRRVVLNLQDVQRVIRGYEEKYSRSSEDFQASHRQSIPESAALRWAAYLDFQREILRDHERVHRGYFRTVRPAEPRPKPTEDRGTEMPDLAA